MERKQKPSIGRIVHLLSDNNHYAAMVTYINKDGKVDLTVFFPGGSQTNYDVAEDSAIKKDNSWHWPERV